MTIQDLALSEKSVLGAHATRAKRVGTTLPFDHPDHLEVSRWLVDEAWILDDQRYQEWLDLLTDDIHYLMPVRVTTALGSTYSTSPGMAHWDENMYSLNRRVARFLTEHAWTEDPPSRLRHYVTNSRTFASDTENELVTDSAVLLFRSRGDVGEPSMVSAQREDVFRRTSEGLKLARRIILVDESVLRTQNLAVFL